MKKIAMSWGEFVLLILLVAAGLGIENASESMVGRGLQGQDPIMEKFEADSGVPILQASLAISQTQLTVAETQLSEQDLELQRQKLALGRLVNLYPSAAAAATSLQTAGITGEALQAYAALYADGEATKRTVSGLENRLAELIKHTVTLDYNCRRDCSSHICHPTAGAGSHRSRVIRCEGGAQQRAIAACSNVGQIGGDECTIPNLSVIAASTLLGSHIPPEALSSYLKLQSDIDIQNGLVKEYERRVVGLRHGISNAVVALAEANRRQRRPWGRLRTSSRLKTRLFSLGLTLFGLLVRWEAAVC